MDLLNVAECAEILRVSQSSVYELIQAGTIPSFRCPSIRVDRAELLSYIESTRHVPPAKPSGKRIGRIRLKHVRLDRE